MNVPVIPLVKEADATDDGVREAFREIKNSLRVPVVNVLFQAYAAMPKFLEIAWRRLRPSVLTAQFGERALQIGALAEQTASGWNVRDHNALLHARAIGNVEMRRMREIVDLFRLVNPKLLIIAHAVDRALRGEAINGTGTAGPSHDHHYGHGVKEFRATPMPLSDERDWPPRVRAIYDEMKAAFRWPFVSNEYRAMSAYPDWLEVWWKDCKACLNDPRYPAAERELGAAAAAAAQALPHRFILSDDLLERNGIEGAKREELMRSNATFLSVLPRSILNMEIARRGLGAEPS